MTEHPSKEQLRAAAEHAIQQLYTCPNKAAMKELMIACIRNKRGAIAAFAAEKAFGTSVMTGQMHGKLLEYMQDDPLPAMGHRSGHHQAQAMISHAVGVQFFGDRKMLCPENLPVFVKWFSAYPKLAQTYREMALTNQTIQPAQIDTAEKLAKHWCNSAPNYDHAHQAQKTGELLGITLPMADEIVRHAGKAELKTERRPSLEITAPPRTPRGGPQAELHR